MGVIPRPGPDVDAPYEAFEDGGHWYKLEVFPARLPMRPSSYLAYRGLAGNLLQMIWEDVVGALCLRFDPRYKLLVKRKPAGPMGGYQVVLVELHPSLESAESRCVELLRTWRSWDFATRPTVSPRELRSAIRASGEMAAD